MKVEWDESKRDAVLRRRGVDLARAALILSGETLVKEDGVMPMAKRAGPRRENTRGNTTQSSTRNAERRSVSSLLGELDDVTEGDIRSVTVEELREMERRGELHPTRPDADEIDLDDSFWDNARWQPPLFPPEQQAPKKASVHLRVDQDVLDWFKAQGRGHLTRMNAVLRAYYEAKREDR